MSIAVVATFYTKDTPHAIQGAKSKLIEAASVYRKEHGTLEWLPLQDQGDPRAFVVYEKFDSEASLQAHRTHPYRNEFVAALTDLLQSEPTVRKFEILE